MGGMGGSRKTKARGFQKGNVHGTKGRRPPGKGAAARPAVEQPATAHTGSGEAAASLCGETEAALPGRARRGRVVLPFGSPGGTGGLRKAPAPPEPSPVVDAPDKQYLVNGKVLAQSICLGLACSSCRKVGSLVPDDSRLARRDAQLRLVGPRDL